MAQAAVEKTKEKSGPDVRVIPIVDIAAIGNLRETNDKELRDSGLVDSVKEQGVIEPVLVRPLPPAGLNLDVKVQAPYQLVLGFRRHRAAELAGLKGIPAEVRELTDAEVTEVQLVENLQRKDLDPLEEARGYEAWMKMTGLGQNQMGAKIGKSQSHVAKRVALLRLPDYVKDPIRRGIMTPAHAEVLMSVPEEAEGLRKEIVREVLHGDVSTKELARDVGWKVDTWKREKADREKKAKWRAGLKFPNCPNDKRPAVVELADWSGYPKGTVSCKAYDFQGHAWNPKTGEAVGPKADRSSGSTRAKPPPPSLETFIVRSVHDVPTILAAIAKSIDPKHVKSVWSGTFAQDVNVAVLADGHDVPDVGLFPWAYSTGERTLIRVEGATTAERRAAKKKWEAWARKNLPRGKAPKPGKVDTEVLEQEGVNAVLDELKEFKEDPEALEAFFIIEADGEKRPGVLNWLKNALSNFLEEKW